MFDSFMINTWAAATMVAIVAGVAGFFVVIRGAAFAAHALPLGAFSGAAAATLLGVDQLIGLVGFSGLGVLGISQLGRGARHEVATALTLVALLALGALFLSMSGDYASGVYALLFGEVLGINNSELPPVAIIGALVLGVIALFYRPLLLNSVSPELGAVRGVAAGRTELLFLSVVALATAMAVPVVGVLLVFSLMIAPAAVARALTNRAGVAVVLSALIAVATVWLAIAGAYFTNWPVGFFVGTAGAVFYGVERGSSSFLKKRTKKILLV
jgi:zinc/manganese transport system permease protein